MNSISSNQLVKGGILLTFIWYLWFKKEKNHPNNREYIILSLFSSTIAIALGKALALTLPFRIRPLHNESLHFIIPHGINQKLICAWSSFPSDHAVLFISLSISIFYISRRIGLYAFFYTIVFILFPRIYLGLHYTTDIIAGAIIGMIIPMIVNSYFVKNKNIQSIVNWSNSKPEFFYPLFFLFTYQIATLFDDSRVIIGWGSKLLN
jgi:undecaprenyl-diphosphatase